MSACLAPPGRRRWLAAAALLCSALAAQPCLAQDARDYPSKLITLIVPYAAGGSSDAGSGQGRRERACRNDRSYAGYREGRDSRHDGR